MQTYIFLLNTLPITLNHGFKYSPCILGDIVIARILVSRHALSGNTLRNIFHGTHFAEHISWNTLQNTFRGTYFA